MRPEDIDGAAGAREALMGGCEAHGVDYIFGLPRNQRLVGAIGRERRKAASEARRTGRPARRFREFTYRTRSSGIRTRRVVAKAEQTGDKANPRFLITSVAARDWPARALNEELYCARGEMENRIKEAQLELFSDRLSAHAFRVNQLRL